MSLKTKAEQEAHVVATLRSMQELVYAKGGGQVAESVKDKDVVIFLGNTRCGKSTLVNYAIGNKLKASWVKKNIYNIVKENPSGPGPTIGRHSTSETSIPTVWQSSKLSGYVVDAPGFQDNRGEAQDVANAFYIKEMINNARSIKFVLISDINDILTNNIAQFISFVETIHTMLPQNSNLLRGMTFVFNKIRDETTREEICEIFKEQILQNLGIQIKNRDIIRYFHDNRNQIALVNMPSGSDLDESQVFGDMISIIENQTAKVQRSTLSQIVPGISDKSRVFLLVAHNILSEWRDLDEVLRSTNKIFSTNLRECNNVDKLGSQEIQNLKSNLTKMEEQIEALRSPTLSVQGALRGLSALFPGVAALREGSDVYTKLRFGAFVDQILQLDESNIFSVKLKAILANMNKKTSECRIDIQEKLKEITEDEADRQYQEMKKAHEKNMADMERRVQELNNANAALLQRQYDDSPSGWEIAAQVVGTVAKVVSIFALF